MVEDVYDDGLTEMLGEQTVCIYKRNCLDSFTAAWSARVFLGEHETFVASDRSSEPPDVEGKHVVIIGFCYDHGLMATIRDRALSVLVLIHDEDPGIDVGYRMPDPTLDGYAWDEHQDAAFDGEPAAAIQDAARACCQITWDFFHGGQRPVLVEVVAEYRLQAFSTTVHRDLAAALVKLPPDFEEWSRLGLALDDEGLRLQVAKAGELLRRYVLHG